jgi:endonuclease I
MIDRYQLLDHGQRALMLKWNRNDPVSDEEIQRNREIYLLQGIYNK